MNARMNTPVKTAVTAALAAAVLTLTACGATSSPTVAGTTATSVTSSMSSAMMSSGSVAMPMPVAPAGPHNQADITFAQQMTIHHRGAIAMADLAPTRADSSQVKTLAVAIKAAQAPELIEMTGWLAAWAPSTDMNGMPTTTAAPSSTTGGTGGMAGMGDSTAAAMPGMMTDQQMTELTAASGVTFDKMFLQLMITHHEGALTMATTEKAEGSNPAALKLADSITISQTAQITQMQTMLKGL